MSDMVRYKKVSERVEVEVEVRIRAGGQTFARSGKMSMFAIAEDPEILNQEFDAMLAPATEVARRVTLQAGRKAWLGLQAGMIVSDAAVHLDGDVELEN